MSAAIKPCEVWRGTLADDVFRQVCRVVVRTTGASMVPGVAIEVLRTDLLGAEMWAIAEDTTEAWRKTIAAAVHDLARACGKVPS